VDGEANNGWRGGAHTIDRECEDADLMGISEPTHGAKALFFEAVLAFSRGIRFQYLHDRFILLLAQAKGTCERNDGSRRVVTDLIIVVVDGGHNIIFYFQR
jgi:hypothetical protein